MVGSPGPSRRRQGIPFTEIRGVLPEPVVVNIPLDPFLSLRALSVYADLSARTLRTHLYAPSHPLPHYRVGGKILVRRSEFDAWMAAYHQRGRPEVDAIVRDVLRDLRY